MNEVDIDGLRCLVRDLGPLGFVDLLLSAQGEAPSVKLLTVVEDCGIDLESLLPEQARPEPAPTATSSPTPTSARDRERLADPVPTSGQVGTIQLGMSAPDIELHFYENGAGQSLPQRLSDLRGTPVVLLFWFPGCQVCQIDMRNLGSAYNNLRWEGEGFTGVQPMAPLKKVRRSFPRIAFHTTLCLTTPVRRQGCTVCPRFRPQLS